MKIISVVGARPNFMKVAPIHKEFKIYEKKITSLICHTGQHFDEKMSKVFFDNLELPKPNFYLGVGSGSHAEQTAKIMIEFEKMLINEKPDMIIVVGDVNSTVACSLAAAKLNIKIAHVEAGLRSFDRTMPEEINRLITDAISDFLFVTERSGLENLKREGVSEEKIFFTGDVMVDTLQYYLPKAEKSPILDTFRLIKSKYILVTMHRPNNVDSKEFLIKFIRFLNALSSKRRIIFPVHPRTKLNLRNFDLEDKFSDNVVLTEPVGYIDFIALMKNSELIVTDSGGIQEESTFLNIQCITIRNNTERPITVKLGTNQLVGTNFINAEEVALKVLNGNIKKGRIPELWDGKAAKRIVKIILDKII